MDEPKFHLEWRIGTPVLLQRLRGYWKADDIKDYRAALQVAINQRPAPTWFKISDVRGFKTQQEEIDSDRVANARYEFASGLVAMVVLHSSDVAQMQRRRIHDHSAEGHLFHYVTTDIEAETVLAQLMRDLGTTP